MAFGFTAVSRAHFRSILRSLLIGSAFLLAAGCASEIREKRFTELVQRFPATTESLKIQPLPGALPNPAAFAGKPVIVMVHPGYALFFRDERRSTYTEAKYDLLEFQLSEETRYISEFAKSGGLMILVIPGNYEEDSIAPDSYVAYLNQMAGGSLTVYYIRTETSHSGQLSMDTTLLLYSFLQNVKTGKILIGGGFIGRCQREFFRQLATYVENIPSFIVPEISSLSPDDISSSEAFSILTSIRQKDYRPVIQFMQKKTDGDSEIQTLTPGARR